MGKTTRHEPTTHEKARRPIGEERAYTIPPDFDPRAYLSNAWGVVGGSGGEPVRVRLRFKKETAYCLREGGLEARLTLGTDNYRFPRELLSWVQSWGPRIEVLEPASLRQRWLLEARQVLEEYAGWQEYPLR